MAEFDGAHQSAQDSFDSVRWFRVLGLMDPRGLSMSPGASFALLLLRHGTNTTGMVQLGYDGSSLSLRAVIRDDQGRWHATAACAIAPSVHTVEADFLFDAMGHVALWIDGECQAKVPGIACGTRGADTCLLGRMASNGKISGTLYVDRYISDRRSLIGGKRFVENQVQVDDALPIMSSVATT
jgi:hypothetical protein